MITSLRGQLVVAGETDTQGLGGLGGQQEPRQSVVKQCAEFFDRVGQTLVAPFSGAEAAADDSTLPAVVPPGHRGHEDT